MPIAATREVLLRTSAARGDKCNFELRGTLAL
jgi:hypothetical protein